MLKSQKSEIDEKEVGTYTSQELKNNNPAKRMIKFLFFIIPIF